MAGTMASPAGTAPLGKVDPSAPAGLGPAKKREWVLALLLLSPSLLLFGVFVYYPLGRTIWLGFHTQDPFGNSQVWVGSDQYQAVLSSGAFHNSLRVTATFALITVPLGIAFGLGLAVLAHQRLRGITFFRTIFSSTVATSVAVASLMWLTLFNPSIGVVNQFLKEIGREPVLWLQDPSTALTAVSLTTVWQNLGITFILMTAGLQSIPDELYESARIDGASPARQFLHITVPMLSPTLLFTSVVLTINAFQSFGQIDLLTQGGPLERTNVIVYSIYEQAFRNFDYGAAAAQAIVLFVIVLALTLIQFRVLERRVFYG